LKTFRIFSRFSFNWPLIIIENFCIDQRHDAKSDDRIIDLYSGKHLSSNVSYMKGSPKTVQFSGQKVIFKEFLPSDIVESRATQRNSKRSSGVTECPCCNFVTKCPENYKIHIKGWY